MYHKGYDSRLARWSSAQGKVLKGPACRSLCPCGVRMLHPPGSWAPAATWKLSESCQSPALLPSTEVGGWGFRHLDFLPTKPPVEVQGGWPGASTCRTPTCSGNGPLEFPSLGWVQYTHFVHLMVQGATQNCAPPGQLSPSPLPLDAASWLPWAQPCSGRA